MDAEVIYARVLPVFREVFDDEELVLTPQTGAKDVAGWDSLTHIRLVVSIESELGIRFAVGEINELKNVGELVALIQKKL